MMGCDPNNSHQGEVRNQGKSADLGFVASQSSDGGTIQVPEEFQQGEGRFNTFCARCHGPHGSGTTMGPPLVHKIYEPNHHGDFAFIRAATQGVRAHHWNFGDMPAVEGVSSNDVKEIIPYIRWLQRQAGIY